MPAAVAVPLLVGAATTAATVYSAKKSSDAATTAAKIQSDTAAKNAAMYGDAVNKALGFQKDVYADSKAALAPYQQLGAGAATTLGRLLGISLPAASAAQPTAQPAPQPTAPVTRPVGTRQPAAAARFRLDQGTDTFNTPDRPMTLAGVTTLGTVRTPDGGMSAGPAVAPGTVDNGSMVHVQAPDGEIRPFPLPIAQQLVARGARIVGGA